MSRGPKPLQFKVCPVCGVNKPRSDYYRKLTTISHKCKACSLADSKRRAPRYFGKYKEYQNAWRREQYATDPEYRTRIRRAKSQKYADKRSELNAQRRHRYRTDPDYRASALAHNKRLRDRQPEWVDPAELRAIYLGCPDGHEVDHIVPLKGRIDRRPVSGLHVPWNLQYLPAAENKRKHCWITEADALG